MFLKRTVSIATIGVSVVGRVNGRFYGSTRRESSANTAVNPEIKTEFSAAGGQVTGEFLNHDSYNYSNKYSF